MKNFLVQYYTPAEAMAEMAKLTPSQQEEHMKPWMDCQKNMGDKMVDFGSPMMGKVRINSKGNETQIHSDLNGYSIIKANDFEEARALVVSHPHLKFSDKAAIEIYECMGMNC